MLVSQAPGNWQDSAAAGERKPVAAPVSGFFKGDRGLPVLILVALLGFALYWTMEQRVFPSASIDLKLNRSQIAELARTYSTKFGWAGAGVAKKTIESTTFTYNDEAKTFLEYQLGAVRANQLMKEEIPVWSWTTRFCKELDIEQFRVWLSPRGEMTAFQLTFEDERRLPSLSHEEAIKLASDFLLKEAGADVGALKLVGDKSSTMAHRDDHSFTWQDERQDFKGAKLRYYVYVAGNRVTIYSKTLHVPDKWTHQYANMRSYNDLLEQIASIFYLPLQYLAFLAVPLALSRRMMRFRVAIFGGLLMALVAGMDSVNAFSEAVDAYNPITSFRDYLSSYYLRELLSTFGAFVSGACLFGGADVVYRFAYPKRVALENYFGFKGFKTYEGLKALIVGHCVFAIHLGWIIAYYLLGDKLGFWCPLSLDEYQILGSALPFFSAISLGVHAAFQEETVARVVALSLMQKLTGRFWVANLFQAAAWGFMHSSYAQQPSYARGIELTIVGLFYGWILRRYGLLPCIIGHYLVDAFLDVKPIFSAQGPFLFLSAFIPLLPFFLIFVLCCATMARAKGAPPADSLTNENLPVAEPHEKVDHEPEVPFVYGPLSRKLRLALSALAVIGLAFALWSHTPAPGDDSRVTYTTEQAQEKATAVLAANGVDPKQYVAVPRLLPRLAAEQLQYVSEKVGRTRTIELAALTQPGFVWQVRFFKFREPREFTVELRGDGREYSFVINEVDDAPGAKLTKEQARDKALAYMHRVHPEYKDLVADKVSLEAHPERNDWTVDFNVPSLKVGDADYRASLAVIGDRVGNFDPHWNVPDSWTQARNERTTKDVWLGILRTVVLSFVLVMVMWWGVGVLRAGRVQWKAAIIIALICASLIFVEQINQLSVFFREYSPDKDQQTFVFQQVLELLQEASKTAVVDLLYVAFALTAYQMLRPGAALITVLKAAFRPANRQAKLVQESLWIDGIIVALAWEGIVQFNGSVLDWFSYWFSPEITVAHIWTICRLPDFYAPVASDVIELFSSFVSSAALYLVAAGILARFAPRFSRYLWLMVVYQLIQASGARHLSDYFIGAGGEIADKVILWIVIVRLARFNPVVYLTKIVLDDALPFLDAIRIYAWPAFTPVFVSFAIYLLFPFIILIYVRVRNKTEAGRPLDLEESLKLDDN